MAKAKATSAVHERVTLQNISTDGFRAMVGAHYLLPGQQREVVRAQAEQVIARYAPKKGKPWLIILEDIKKKKGKKDDDPKADK